MTNKGAKPTYRSFKAARELARKKKFKSNTEYTKWVKAKGPSDMPPYPDKVYDEWKGWINYRGAAFVSYKEAKKFARSLNLQLKVDWENYVEKHKIPENIPKKPKAYYEKREEWESWPKFLGSKILAKNTPKTAKFKECQKFALENGIKTIVEWRKWYNEGKLPKHFPKGLEQHLKRLKQWKGSEHFFKKETTHALPYEKALPIAQKFCRKRGITTRDEWTDYAHNSPIPKGLPIHPPSAYGKKAQKSLWQGWKIWCGVSDEVLQTKRNWLRNLVHVSYKEHQKFAKKNNIKTGAQYRKFCKEHPEKVPTDIVYNPDAVFEKTGEWPKKDGWYVFLEQPKNPWCTYEEAKEFAKKIQPRITGRRGWSSYATNNKLPKINGKKIPRNVQSVYKIQGTWIDWFDFLGAEDLRKTFENTKKLVRALVNSTLIFQRSPKYQVCLARVLIANKIYNAMGKTKSSEFLKQLQSAALVPQGLRKIINYAESDELEQPDLSDNVAEDSEQLAEGKPLKEENLEESDYGETFGGIPIPKTEDILKITSIRDSKIISIDDKLMKFLVTFVVQDLWNRTFLPGKETETVNDVKKWKKSNDLDKEVISTFLNEYNETRKLKIPKGYSFPKKPYLMQKYVAYKVSKVKERYFANFSEPGSGKTNSAILASRVIKSKTTLVLCPKSIVDQWGEKVLEMYPDSEIHSGGDVFKVSKITERPRFLILNYDKFNQAGKKYEENIAKLQKLKLDFIILDEIQNAKSIQTQTGMKQGKVSRRTNLQNLLNKNRKKNPKSRILGLSGTPIINTLKEGRSLLELLSGLDHSHVKTDDRFFYHGIVMFEELTNISVRQRHGHKLPPREHPPINVDAGRLKPSELSWLDKNPMLMETYLTDYRIPKIINCIKGQTIIYTDYVAEKTTQNSIIKKITDALDARKITWGLYTGSTKNELKRFSPEKKFQVLICSRPISVGVDGLQMECHRIIFNSLPWTNAQYEQIIARIARKGQKKRIDIYQIHARIPFPKNGRTKYYEYDRKFKLQLIAYKKIIANCAVDGILPNSGKGITMKRALREARRWYERLERDDYNFVFLEELDTHETVQKEKQIRRKYGDLEKMHRLVNISLSTTNHARLQKDPNWIIAYHKEYRKAREAWAYIPYEHWIEKLRGMKERLVIGDFGCGEAKIRQAIGPRVKSIDHVSIESEDGQKNNDIISCDMIKTPLDDDSLDVVIFSLSLWGRNWRKYFKEARRCLGKKPGSLFVTETITALKGRRKDLEKVIEKNGFKIYNKQEIDRFVFIEARLE